MNEKGRAFTGMMGGAAYDRWASALGMGMPFYRKAVGELELPGGARVLDLGCGTGSLSVALAAKLDGSVIIYGVDISDEQLDYARAKAKGARGEFHFLNRSMDDLKFSDGYFDAVITSMAFHETPPAVRRGAIRETERVLKRNGHFVFVDWSRPKAGLLAAVWLPFLFIGDWKDNWHNVYRPLCEERGLVLREDRYINSLARRQVFIKK